MKNIFTYRLYGDNSAELIGYSVVDYRFEDGIRASFEAPSSEEAERLVADLNDVYHRHKESWNKPQMRKWVHDCLPYGVEFNPGMALICAEKTNKYDEIQVVTPENVVHAINKPADIEIFGITWKEKK